MRTFHRIVKREKKYLATHPTLYLATGKIETLQGIVDYELRIYLWCHSKS